MLCRASGRRRCRERYGSASPSLTAPGGMVRVSPPPGRFDMATVILWLVAYYSTVLYVRQCLAPRQCIITASHAFEASAYEKLRPVLLSAGSDTHS
eukprot:12010551-Heterocapsa_arctica.AAC.1